MSEMVERVARAICKQQTGVDPDTDRHCIVHQVVGYREGSSPATKPVVHTQPWWKAFEKEARAAIAAHETALKETGYVIVPREPTEAMLDAGGACDIYRGQASWAWREMIEAALK